jgi:hypothetical protein
MGVRDEETKLSWMGFGGGFNDCGVSCFGATG